MGVRHCAAAAIRHQAADQANDDAAFKRSLGDLERSVARVRSIATTAPGRSILQKSEPGWVLRRAVHALGKLVRSRVDCRGVRGELAKRRRAPADPALNLGYRAASPNFTATARPTARPTARAPTRRKRRGLLKTVLGFGLLGASFGSAIALMASYAKSLELLPAADPSARTPVMTGAVHADLRAGAKPRLVPPQRPGDVRHNAFHRRFTALYQADDQRSRSIQRQLRYADANEIDIRMRTSWGYTRHPAMLFGQARSLAYVRLGNLPAGAIVSRGVPFGYGAWLISRAELRHLIVWLPDLPSAEVKISVYLLRRNGSVISHLEHHITPPKADADTMIQAP